jgi:hypothetical protein
MAIVSAYLTTTTSNVFISDGNTATMTFYFSNYSTSADATFSLWAVNAATTSPANLHVLYSNVYVQAGDTYVADRERIFLDNGDKLMARCNANSVMSVTLTHVNI